MAPARTPWLAWSVPVACSGCAALLYQLCWLRVYTLSVGATLPAISVVLAGFMLGLGLGSYFGGRWADRRGDLVRDYVLLELATLLLAAAVPWEADWVGSVAVPAIGLVPGRALVAGCTLLLPTFAMGATFPILLAAARPAGFSKQVFLSLYGVNLAAATAGAVLGGLVLPYAIGVYATLGIAAALNAAAALAAMFAGRRLPGRVGAEAVPARQTLPGKEAGALMALAGCGGLLSLASELIWTRSILQIDRSAFAGMAIGTAEVVALVITCVLLGNALGTVLAGGAADAAAVGRRLAAAWALGGVAMLAGLESVGVQLQASPLLVGDPALGNLLRPMMVVPAAVLLGVPFPLLVRFAAEQRPQSGHAMGWVWLASTLGATAGSIGAGWWVIPALGVGRGLLLTAGLSTCLAATVLVVGRARWSWVWPTVGAAAVLVAVAGLTLPTGPGALWRAQLGEDAVVASWEGWEATTVIVQIPRVGSMMVVNGLGIPAGEGYVTRGTNIASRLPEDGRVLLVGFGTGLLAEGILRAPRLAALTIVEIDGSQFRAGRWFNTESVLQDPRVTTVVDDATHYIAGTPERFDLVVVDAWGPEVSQAIYSTEFHLRALEHLTENGRLWAKFPALDAESRVPVLDAVRCTYPAAGVEGREGELQGLVGARSRSALGLATSVAPTAAEAPCDPLSYLHPRRLRSVPVLPHR